MFALRFAGFTPDDGQCLVVRFIFREDELTEQMTAQCLA
jgi:hypothetical protein